MNKKLTVLAMTALLSGATTMSAFATEKPNPAGGNTDVYIGVTKTAPANISVTVPTSLAIAVVDDGAKIDTLMGNYMVDDKGKITTAGDAAQGIHDKRVSFINESATVNAKVVSAKIVNSYGSKWSLKDTTTAKYDMKMTFNKVQTGNVAPGSNNTMMLGDFALPANQTTHMEATAVAGGTVGDYLTPEESAKSFVIEWNIQAQ